MEITPEIRDMLNETKETLSGYKRRHFMAQVVETMLDGSPMRAEKELGWNRVTVGKALDELRRKGRRVEQPLPETDSEGPHPEAPDELGGHLDVLTVRRALATLSPIDRAVLTLVDLEGWPMAEAAKMLGLTYVAIKLRASRARRKLAGVIREGGLTEPTAG